MNDQEIEQMIQAKGLNAPRITPADIQAAIRSEHYFTAYEGALFASSLTGEGSPLKDDVSRVALGLLTICVLVLRNGFTVTGESACASPENFDAETGRQVARQNAINKIWPLLGYQLKCRLTEGQEVRA